MPELRLILFVAGALFLVALVIREWARVRRGARAAEAPVTRAADAARPAEVAPRAVARAVPDIPDDLPVIEVGNDPEIDVSFASSAPQRESVATAARPAAWESEGEPEATPPLVIDWPADAERRIVALRIVPRNNERFSGRSVRQALVGEGFRHGPMNIFHQAAGDGRVVLSAASLTKPGTFEPQTMDAERFAGLNLFSVLPGPLPADEAFDRLVEAGRGVAARLNAELRDPRGAPLTAARVVEMRAEVSGVAE